ncbi:hypothetical protein BSL82_10200 [Tardibacter chloracetimidivorans]|uniref:Uncharacterized protein n=1 Tax=Tardibacter chloracetimidivorans TaxID=1921510 RepID=A0A1L3ZVG2_9SPHN|nr:hypothetical protein [Tardibacter chloracetimidivorans]API59644.1 hypothetical protein BSL82_10200 [Tardibacter chloracetimidivorans]
MDVAAIITALCGTLLPIGGGIAFVWNKVSSRFEAIEAKLDACEQRDKANAERRAVQATAIDLMLDELQRIAPMSAVLAHVRSLVDKLKADTHEH